MPTGSSAYSICNNLSLNAPFLTPEPAKRETTLEKTAQVFVSTFESNVVNEALLYFSHLVGYHKIINVMEMTDRKNCRVSVIMNLVCLN